MKERNDLEKELLQERSENFGCEKNYGLDEDTIIGESPQEAAGVKGRRYTITRKGVAVLMAVCLVFSGLFGFGGAMLASSLTGTSGSGLGQGILPGGAGLSETGYDLSAQTGSELTVQEIIALTANSVVEIRTETVSTDSWMQQYVTEGAGSGVIISGDGYIMTNNHVINGASKINITLKDGTEYEAVLVGTDSQTDVAVLKINATGLTSAVYGNSDSLVVGDLAVVIGNPLGELGGSATAGIISALDRQLTLDGKSMTLLQTDASINPGNSGGGLFNQYGQLVGIVVAKSAGSNVEGLGFSIPINQAKEVAAQLVDHGYVTGRPAMGVTIVDLTSIQRAVSYGVRNLGIYIQNVDTDGAKTAGFQSGDMLHYIGDTQITAMSDVTAALNEYKVGDTVKVTVIRDNQTIDLNVKLSEKKSG